MSYTSHTFVVVSITTASPCRRFACRPFSQLLHPYPTRLPSPIPAAHFVPPPAHIPCVCRRRCTVLIPLVSFSNFMLHSFCLLFPERISGLMWDVDFRVRVAGTDAGSRRFCVSPRLGSAGVQLTQRAFDFLHRNLSHTRCRTTQTLTPRQRSHGGITSRIR